MLCMASGIQGGLVGIYDGQFYCELTISASSRTTMAMAKDDYENAIH